MAKHLLSLFPEHKIYVEVFGGAGNLLFLKQPSKIEVYNDIWDELVNLFRVLQDERKSLKLFRMLLFEFNSVQMFADNLAMLDYTSVRGGNQAKRKVYKVRDNVDVELNEIRRAAYFYSVMKRSFNGQFGYGFSKNLKRPGHSFEFFNALVYLPLFHLRLEGVIIENNDFEKILEKYDGLDTLFYVDPPYFGKGDFRSWDKFEEKDHERLLKRLNKIKGMAVLSGYKCDLYDEYLDEWEEFCFDRTTSLASVKTKKSKKVVEYVWRKKQKMYGGMRK